MKNYLIVAMILIAGITAYPQATRSAREAKTEKGSAKKEANTRTVTRSESNSKRSARVERSNSITSRPETTRPKAETTRSKTEKKTSERTLVTPGTRETGRKKQENNRSWNNSGRRTETSNTVRREQTSVNRAENKSGRTVLSDQNRESGNSEERNFRANSSSASRTYREGKGTLTRDDGSVVRHDNDKVFGSQRFKLDFDNYESLRRSDEFRREYRDYDNWRNHRTIRVINHNHNRYIPIPWEVRRSRYYYRTPLHINLVWTPLLFHRFMFYYPSHDNWDLEFGSQIETTSADEAGQYAGSIRRVYGKVDEVFYSPEDENYILYIGAPFPYQDLSVVIPKHIAQNLSRSPKWYFENEFVWVIGLINMWEGKPEIIVRDEEQIRRY